MTPRPTPEAADVLLWPAPVGQVPGEDLAAAMEAALEWHALGEPETDWAVRWAVRRGRDVCVHVEEA